MLDRQPYLHIRDDDTKRLRTEFDDNRIYFGFNVLSQELEAWYKPDSGRAYKISGVRSVQQAIQIMRKQLRYEKMRALDLLKEIDDHNDALTAYKENDAMTEVKSELKRIATGRQYFTMANPQAKKHHVNG